MCLMQYIRSLYKLLSNYRDRRFQNTVKHLRWGVLQKEQCLGAGACNQKRFRAERVGLVKLGQANKRFIKNTKKEASQENVLEIFLLDTLKTIF